MKKKALIPLILCLAFAVVLTGCSGGNSGDSSKSKSNEPEAANIGDVINVETSYGDLNITVEGFEANSSLTEQERQSVSTWSADDIFCALLLTVENVSYEDTKTYPSDTIRLNKYSYLLVDGAAIEPLSSAFPYGNRTTALGGCVNNFPVGKNGKVAIPYCVTNVPETVVARVGDYEVTIPVSHV